MQKYLLLFGVVFSLFTNCNKTTSEDAALLVGNWRMISVQDRGSFGTIPNPGNMGEVIITFSAGKLSGKTPGNDIWPGNYTAGPGNKLSVPGIGGTKVGENAWGALFYNNMYFIESFSFTKSNRLFIGTKEKLLGFERL